ncbi:hypothetical protein [Photobacterium iliopiscarium]|uniref:hypothetical protein n=1 Tax=Photobacterium iliopiscarium TaxID=56192 RepID=UPI00242B1DF2|nr:hypothetical protein [Photobacterium iliopiscarium]
MKKIIVQCASNRAHHLHVYDIIFELIKNNHVYILYNKEEDLGIFNDFKCYPNVYFCKSDFSFNIKNIFSPDYIFRIIRCKFIREDLNLSLYNIRNIIEIADVIIFTDLCSGNIVKKINNKIKVVWGMHGPVASSHTRSMCTSNVDLICSPGKTTSECFVNVNVKEIGSVKLNNLLSKKRSRLELFSVNRKTVLFNPHFNEKLGASSWVDHGIEILDFFSNNKDYNLIFAPHPRLCDYIDLSVVKQYIKFNNIIIDINSEKLTNLFYEPYVDIYLGDISSQAFEYAFLKKRKFIFFKSKFNTSETNKLQSMGVTVTDFTEFKRQINFGLTEIEIKNQQSYLNDVFKNETRSSAIAAEFIIEL